MCHDNFFENATITRKFFEGILLHTKGFKSLQNRHVQVIALGGAIGTGLFLGFLNRTTYGPAVL